MEAGWRCSMEIEKSVTVDKAQKVTIALNGIRRLATIDCSGAREILDGTLYRLLAKLRDLYPKEL